MSNINNYVHFACHGQAGHTVLAQLIDAHPNAMIGEEIGVAYRVLRGKWTFERALKEIQISSASNVNKCQDRRSKRRGYGSWRPNLGRFTKAQGPTEDIRVIGDKLGWQVVTLQELQDKLGVPVKVIHAIRNPFDVVAAWYTGGRKYQEFRDDPNGLSRLVDRYIKIVDPLYQKCYKSDWPADQLLAIKNEELRHHPKELIESLLEFLNLDIDSQWIVDVSNHIDPEISNKSANIEWTDKAVERIYTDVIGKYEFLQGYQL